MTESMPTCDEYSIEVPAPKDAENRKVPLDTKVMYNDKGIKYEVVSLIFGTSKRCAGWDVECSTSDSDCIYTRPLDSMYLEKPDSIRQLVEDIERAQYACDRNGMHMAACRYSGNDTCCGCDFKPEYSTCAGEMLRDIVARINRLAGDSE